MGKTGHNETISGGGFHHIALRVFDFDKTMHFYVNGLGFQKAHAWGRDGRSEGQPDSRAVMLDTGDGNYLEVFAGGAKPAEEVTDGVLLHFAIRTSDVKGATERARAHGGRVTIEPKKVTPDHSERPLEFHIAFVRGLDGEVIEFFDNPEL